MSALDPVILAKLTAVADAIAATTDPLPPLGRIVEWPDGQIEIKVGSATYLRSGALKDLGAAAGDYPETLAALCPVGAMSTVFPSSEFSATSVACSDDTVVFTRNAATGQLYVARRASGFTFEVMSLPMSGDYRASYVNGVWFFLPSSSGSMIVSEDDLATFRAISTVSYARRVRWVSSGAGYFLVLSSASSSISEAAIHSFTNGVVGGASIQSLGTTYVLDIVWSDAAKMFFFIRGGATMQKATALSGTKTNVVPVPAQLGSQQVASPLLNEMAGWSYAAIFGGKLIYPLPGAGVVQLDPETSEASLLIASSGFNGLSRIWTTPDGKWLLATGAPGVSAAVYRFASLTDQLVWATADTSNHVVISRKIWAAVPTSGQGLAGFSYVFFVGARTYAQYKYVRIV